MRLFVDVSYHGQMSDMTRVDYVALVEEAAATLGATSGQDWHVSRVGTAPFRQAWPPKQEAA